MSTMKMTMSDTSLFLVWLSWGIPVLAAFLHAQQRFLPRPARQPTHLTTDISKLIFLLRLRSVIGENVHACQQGKEDVQNPSFMPEIFSAVARWSGLNPECVPSGFIVAFVVMSAA